MLKNTVLSSIIFLSSSSVVFAESTHSYVGGGIGVSGYNQVGGLYGASANVFAGKGQLLGEKENFYLGGEIGANVGIRPKSAGVSASIIPGVMLTKSTMIYSRIGLASDYYPKSNITFGTEVGVGLQTNITKHWDARVEYTSFSTKSSQAGVGLVYKFD